MINPKSPPSPNLGYVIFWYNTNRNECEWEVFESYELAEMKFEDWNNFYPHNEYSLAKIERKGRKVI